MSQFLKEFREFAMRGNVIDLAVGVIIGSAFGKIVSSLVSDIIMPPIGFLTGGVNFSDLKYTFRHAGANGTNAVLNYGAFLQNVVDFLIIALVIFLMIRMMNRLRRKNEAKAEPQLSAEERLLTEIRDILRSKN